MDYEKKYKEALEKARQLCAYPTTKPFISDMQDLFPELKESEDKKMIQYFKDLAPFDKADELYEKYGFSHKDAIAWLEKQGEHTNFLSKIQVGDKVTRNEDGVLVNLSQLNRVANKDKKQGEQRSDIGISSTTRQKLEVNLNNALATETCESWNKFLDKQKPADKVEPKFHEDDWIIYDGWTTQIKEVYEDGYSILHQGFIPKEREEEMRLWTIQDAKEGDALQLGKVTAIFKEFIDNKYCKCYCSVYNGGFEIPSQDSDDNCYGCDNATPATKEQREQLEKAMAENGYEWDSEMKELKKIEQNLAWSEEDKMMLQSILDEYKSMQTEKRNWLKSLKGRVQLQQQEWSKDDELNRQDTIRLLVDAKERYLQTDASIPKCIKWLENLSPQPHWKPSDEQMKALGVATNISNVPEKEYQELEKLYQDLLKLGEE